MGSFEDMVRAQEQNVAKQQEAQKRYAEARAREEAFILEEVAKLERDVFEVLRPLSHLALPLYELRNQQRGPVGGHWWDLEIVGMRMDGRFTWPLRQNSTDLVDNARPLAANGEGVPDLFIVFKYMWETPELGITDWGADAVVPARRAIADRVARLQVTGSARR